MKIIASDTDGKPKLNSLRAGAVFTSGAWTYVRGLRDYSEDDGGWKIKCTRLIDGVVESRPRNELVIYHADATLHLYK